MEKILTEKKCLRRELDNFRREILSRECGKGLDWDDGKIPAVDVVLIGAADCGDAEKSLEKAVNQAAWKIIEKPESGRGEMILFLDRSAELLDHALDEMVWTLVNRPEIKRLGARLLRVEDGFLPEKFSGRKKEADDPDYSFLHRGNLIYQSCFMIRRSDYEELAGGMQNFPAETMPGDYVAPLARMLLPESEMERVLKFSAVPPEKKRRILYFDAEVPMADRGSGGMDAVFFIDWMLKRGYEVVFFGDYTAGYVEKYTSILLRRGVECVYLPYRTAAEYLEKYGAGFDYVFVSRIYVAETFDLLLRRYCLNAAWIFNTVDLHFVREKMEAELHHSERELINAENTRLLELSMLSLADAGIVISTDELELLEKTYHLKNVRHIPQARRLYGRKKGFDGRHGMVFIGSAHQPNVDAVIYYTEEIAPLIAEFAPDLKLTVIGEALHEELKKTPQYEKIIQSGKIEFAGFVPDLREYLDECILTIAPLRYGAGTKGKVASSFCCGVPCVSSAFGSEGTGMIDGVHLLTASNAAEFAGAVKKLLTDPELWERISEGGMEFIRQNYSFERVEKMMDELFAFADMKRDERLKRIVNLKKDDGRYLESHAGKSGSISAEAVMEMTEYFNLPAGFKIMLNGGGAVQAAEQLKSAGFQVINGWRPDENEEFSLFAGDLPETETPEKFIGRLYSRTLPGGRVLLGIPEERKNGIDFSRLEKKMKKSRFAVTGIFHIAGSEKTLLYLQRHIPEILVCSRLAVFGVKYFSIGGLKSEVMRRLPKNLRVPAKRVYQRIKRLF